MEVSTALRRGDSPSNEHCVNRIKAASLDILTKCPHQKEAFIWGGGTPECLMHYADHPVFGKLDLPHGCIEYGGNLTEVLKSNLTEFDQIWERLTDGLMKKVSMGSSRLKFVAFQMIYSLMQCTPDLSRSDSPPPPLTDPPQIQAPPPSVSTHPLLGGRHLISTAEGNCTPDLSQSDCDIFLRQSVADFQACCLRSARGKVLRANCYFEWSLNPFYSPHTDDTLLSTIAQWYDVNYQANITITSYNDPIKREHLDWNEGTAADLIDPYLGDGSTNEIMKCIHIGLPCVQESVSDKPTLASVIHMLNSDLDFLCRVQSYLKHHHHHLHHYSIIWGKQNQHAFKN
ncbi:hypothetical protein EZV62_026474 [Acer yangbiense]|uniref:Gnk2-homologous domain-containing protein n=1 Tax=Acer yangbiense TaxID=1000413 RepID=A0A5C7GRL8_9ROSI|nr:hypothetical protein EZV62_026474 [Acer yangbiense]